MRIYKQATIHIYFVALGYVCFESLMGGTFWGSKHWHKKFTGEIWEGGSGGKSCRSRMDGVLFVVLSVTGQLKALFDTTTTCLGWILLMKGEGFNRPFLTKGDFCHNIMCMHMAKVYRWIFALCIWQKFSGKWCVYIIYTYITLENVKWELETRWELPSIRGTGLKTGRWKILSGEFLNGEMSKNNF